MHRILALSGIVKLATKLYRRQNPMQLDTITGLINIPDHKVTEVLTNTEHSLHLLLKPVNSALEADHTVCVIGHIPDIVKRYMR